MNHLLLKKCDQFTLLPKVDLRKEGNFKNHHFFQTDLSNRGIFPESWYAFRSNIHFQWAKSRNTLNHEDDGQTFKKWPKKECSLSFPVGGRDYTCIHLNLFTCIYLTPFFICSKRVVLNVVQTHHTAHS